MASKLDLVNQALLTIGAKSLTSLSDNTPGYAITAASIIDQVIRFIILDGAFPSCIRRDTLNVLTDAPEYGYRYQFQLPTEPRCLKILDMYEGSYKLGYADYVIEGDKLLTNYSPVQVRYLADTTDVGSYDAAMNECIISKLRADLAISVGLSAATAQALQVISKQVMTDAKSIVGQQGQNKQVWSDDLIDIR